jgi:ferredoxin-like protein FixX
VSGPVSIVDEVGRALAPSGIATRGTINFGKGEGPPMTDGSSARSVLLLGNVGGSIWPSFATWQKGYDGADPLDTWSKSTIRPLAASLDAMAYFPSDPPWQPFQQWAMRAEGIRPSPLGILIHPIYGLWHGYRGALGFRFEIEETVAFTEHPCNRCHDKPCLSACPAGAVRAEGFDVAACRSHLRVTEAACGASGCLARNACPVGPEFRYPAEQLGFHMDSLKG